MIPSRSENHSSLFRLLVGFLSLSALLQKVGATDLTIGLVAHYPLDGNTNDMSGNGNHGTPHSISYTMDRHGNSNSAASFNGVSSYFAANGAAFDFAGDMSISLGFNPASTQVEYAGLIEKGTYTGEAGFVLQQSSVTTNAYYFTYIYSYSGAGSSIPVPVIENNWNHLVLSKQSSTITCYLNGVLLNTHTNLIPATILQNGNIPLLVGAENGGVTVPETAVTRFYNGFMDNLRIYNRALSSNEAFQLYNEGSPTSQPSQRPSSQPSSKPSSQPSRQPNSQPSAGPTGQPSVPPSSQPSVGPTGQPSVPPTSQPSAGPTGQPSVPPTSHPTVGPTGQPSEGPTGQPSVGPTGQPSEGPTGQPSVGPTGQPSEGPTGKPSV
ncbi:MAG: PT domain-containing protein, partial [Legionellaceae bacterium]|nr:PT domain-containing protein [Legionellaceae bacterium]